jgi:hypothetical protein
MTRSRKPESLAQRVATVAVELATQLARDWRDAPYDDLRGAVIYAVYAEIANAQGLRAPPLELVEPHIPAIAALKMRMRICENLPLAELTPELFGCVQEALTGFELDATGALTAGRERRRRGVHFTPPELARKVVARTLEPLLKCMEKSQPNRSVGERALMLRTCDPSVGAGAFLCALIRELAPHVLKDGLASDIHEAKRLVAIHVAYGVDKCAMAVYACKLAMRLECRADCMPADWLDDNIRHGDALVGLDREQIASFNWKRGQPEIPELARMWDRAMAVGTRLREERVARLSQIARSAV